MIAPIKSTRLDHAYETLNPLSESAHKWLFGSALPVWTHRGFNWAQGIWHESLSLKAEPTDENHRARVQGRQTYVYALVSELGNYTTSRVMVHAGISGIRNKYTANNGLLISLLSQDGETLDEKSKLYDQTFYLLALAKGRSYIPDAKALAEKLIKKIIEDYKNPDGLGYVENCSQHKYQSNSHMHLLEATLAWAEACKEDGVSGGKWETLANEVCELAADKFIDRKGKFLREFFEPNWEPKSGNDGTIVEPGHQFEWAWLLARWARFTNNAYYLALAKQLFDAGTKGINNATGAAVNTMNEKLEMVTEESRLWPQTEWLKAALILLELSPSPEQANYLEHVEKAYQTVSRYLETPKAGLWFDHLRSNNTFVENVSPASSFYHIACAIEQLVETKNHIGMMSETDMLTELVA